MSPPEKLDLYEGYLRSILPLPEEDEEDTHFTECNLDDILQEVGCGPVFQRLALDILKEEPTGNGNIKLDQRMAYLHDWLRFSQSDSSLERQRWSYLATLKDFPLRDDFTRRLWHQVDASGSPEDTGPQFRKYVTSQWADWPYYQKHFFGWFLGRFDLRSARAVFVEKWWSKWFDVLLCLFALILSSLSLEFFFGLEAGLVTALAFLLIVGGVGWAWSKRRSRPLPLFAFIHSLTPRLAAGVGIGYLFIFSAPHLVQILHRSKKGPGFLWGACLLLVLVALVYIAFHISRRVHPELPGRQLFCRSASILALAITYSSVGLLIAGPVLFSKTLLGGPAGEVALPRLALCAAIALNLGVILQLAWDEKPLTEPL